VSENDAAIAALDHFIAEQAIDRNQADWKTALPRPPQAEFDASKRYLWNIATNLGDMVIQLMPDVAPMHVSSTIYLARLGFYDSVIFHRVITGFMAQGGDPLGQGTGGPGYDYDGEFSPRARHDRPGLLSMANAGPGTDGSQFFLTFVPTPHLDDKHTIFGEVVDGMETVKQLEERGSSSGRTTEDLLMRTTTISVG
jgi:cyclophilin family peptidyl-prolyl cis-trans isomerase